MYCVGDKLGDVESCLGAMVVLVFVEGAELHINDMRIILTNYKKKTQKNNFNIYIMYRILTALLDQINSGSIKEYNDQTASITQNDGV